MRLSVIMPVYNHAHFLPRAVTALANQSMPPDELILVDDGSEDDTANVIADLSRKYSFIRAVRMPENGGTNAAVAHVRHQAKGEFVYFAAADDQVMPGFIAETLNLLLSHPNAAFCSALAAPFDTTSVTIYGNIPFVEPGPIYISPLEAADIICRYGTWFSGNTAVYRRTTLEEMGGFDKDLGPFSDGFLCMALALRDGCAFIPKVFCRIHLAPESTSKTSAGDGKEMMRILTSAHERMTGQLASIFPTSVIEAWSAHWRFSIAVNAMETPAGERRKQLRHLIPPLFNAELPIILGMIRLNRRLARAYVLLRLAPKVFVSRLWQEFSS